MNAAEVAAAAATVLPTSIGGVVGTGLLALFVASLLAGSDAGNMSKGFAWQFRLAAALRTPVLVFVVVPMSFSLWVYRTARLWYYGAPVDESVTGHDERVQEVVDQIVAWDAAGRKQRMRTARPNWAAMSLKLGSNKASSHQVRTHHLNRILKVDEEAMTLRAEPGVTMGDITSLLMPKGMALLLQIEMEAITIGGLSMGLGMEANSHNVGWFQETVVEFEIVTAESPPRVRRITKENDPDLFYALPHSVGTLGFLVSVTVKLTRIKPYVHVHYIMTKSAKQLQDTMTRLSEADGDAAAAGMPGVPTGFLEATVYSKHTAVVQCGEMVEEPTKPEERAKINGINWWWKPFYFRWLETLLHQGHETYDEYIPLKHYYHRFTRSIFWEIEDMIPFANHPLYRFFWGWMGAPEVSLLKLFQGPVIRKNSVNAHVVQESCMPVRMLEEGLDKFEEWWDIYPLLLFPLRTYDRGIHSGFLNPHGRNLAPKKGANWGIWVDLAAYGTPKVVREGGDFDPKKFVRKFEHWTRDAGGWAPYYTDIFCTRKEYRQMFDHVPAAPLESRLKGRRGGGCSSARPTCLCDPRARPSMCLPVHWTRRLDLSDAAASSDPNPNPNTRTYSTLIRKTGVLA